MKKLSLLFLLLFALSNTHAQPKHAAAVKPPAYLIGTFEDDYQIRYEINDTLWLQLPSSRYHIIKWNFAEKYLIARNDGRNPGEGGLYTRIDYMEFSNMAPWKWGFCLTAYKAESDKAAEATAAADRDHPMKGCNSFPFSRMKRVR